METGPNLTLDQVTALAPDAQSLTSARPLLSLRYWQDLGQSEQALWGRCQGSQIYQVSVELELFAYRCPCPSRKRPCRHVLGLLLLATATPEALRREDHPDWVQQWLDQRRSRQQRADEKGKAPAKPVDAAARQKRVERRDERVQAGLEQLTLWLCDIVRQGLGRPEVQQLEFWDAQARRMVDAQAPGLAGRLRGLAEIPHSGSDWPERLLSELGRLMLLIQAYDRLDQLPAAMQSEVRQLVGWTVSQEELEQEGESLADCWLVVGQRTSDDDRLRTQRSWLLGKRTGRTALVLQFAPGAQGFPEMIEPATQFEGTLRFYPGVTCQRARLIERTGSAEPIAEFPGGHELLASMLSEYADGLAASPWMASHLCVLSQMTLARSGEVWHLRDRTGASVPLSWQEPWPLLAESGGEPFDVVAEWTGEVLIPLSTSTGGRMRSWSR